jgi:hypothetical protein
MKKIRSFEKLMVIACLLLISACGKTNLSNAPTFSSDQSTKHRPVMPFSPSPLDSSVIHADSISLGWKCFDQDKGDIVKYDLYFGEENPPIEQIGWQIINKKFLVSNLKSGKTYYWQIIAIDQNEATTVGNVWRFTTNFKSK